MRTASVFKYAGKIQLDTIHLLTKVRKETTMKRFTVTKLITALVVLVMFTLVTTGWAQMEAAAKLKPLADAYTQAWNSGDLKALDAIVDQNFMRHASPTLEASAAGLDSLKHVIAHVRAEYPDFHVTLTEEIYTPDKIVARWQFSGTHSGVGLPAAKGKKVQATGMSLIHVKNGKFTEEWVESDGAMTMQQMGFTMTPPAEMKK
jgi:predicted ester cyclase